MFGDRHARNAIHFTLERVSVIRVWVSPHRMSLTGSAPGFSVNAHLVPHSHRTPTHNDHILNNMKFQTDDLDRTWGFATLSEGYYTLMLEPAVTHTSRGGEFAHRWLKGTEFDVDLQIAIKSYEEIRAVSYLCVACSRLIFCLCVWHCRPSSSRAITLPKSRSPKRRSITHTTVRTVPALRCSSFKIRCRGA